MLLKRFKKTLVGLSLIFLCASASGCFYFVIGAAAAGGYAISQDTIQGETDKDFESVWDAAAEIVSILGTVSSQSHELGKLTAMVNGSKVTVSVIQLTSSATRLKVKARKALFPNIATAQNVYIKIVNRVNE